MKQKFTLLTLILLGATLPYSEAAKSSSKGFHIYGVATYGLVFDTPDSLNITNSNSAYFDNFTTGLLDNFGMTLGVYVPAMSSLGLGLLWHGSFNSGLTYNSQNAYSTYSNIALSALFFPAGSFGQGFFVKADVGRGTAGIYSGRTFLSSQNTQLESFVGLGTALEVGYALGEDRSFMLGVQGQLRKMSEGNFTSLHLTAGTLW